VHFFLQCIVLVTFLVAFRRGPAVEYLPLILPGLLALLLFTGAMGVLLGAINVKFRDMQHLVEIGLLIWFWAVPIVYQYRLVRDRAATGHSTYHWIWYVWRLNPITPIVITFQRALYGATSPKGANGAPIHILPDHATPWWFLWQLGLVIVFALVLLALALKLFSHLEGNFAEEL
jgi:ABC-2 type transport system permease protein